MYELYAKSASFIEFIMECCIYDDDIVVAILVKDKKLLHFEVSQLGQILRVDKTGFLRPGYKLVYLTHIGDITIIIILYCI